ncbi:acyltransferase [Rhizobium sp. FY34]|uniref:acyltransferase family protein n=1 Tax=Rhizobium sp. FY34 TaxID=2562309 RepID=UPI0010C14CCC|nr:acyltransferase [Rhizobium sp. FY34]
MTVDQNISSRINLMRILLICGIVFVHVPYDVDASPFLQANGAFDWMRVFLGESLFRIGVPCLSAISGYLLFQRGYDAFDYRKTLISKSRTVLLPFLLWNFALLILVLAVQRMDMGLGYFPDLWGATRADWLDHTLAFNDFPVNLPLYFLRDLLVCIILSPILAFLVRHAPAMTLGILFAIAVVPALDTGLVLKDSILFSFTLGIYLALFHVDLKALDRYAPVAFGLLLVVSALLALGLFHTGPDFPLPIHMARNALSIIGVLGFWLLSAPLVRTSGGQWLSRTGSLSFWIFCGHYPLLMVMWMVWNRSADASIYPIFYVGAVLLTFAAVTVSNRLALNWMPGVYGVLTGNRGRASTSRGSAGQHAADPAGSPPASVSGEQR